MLHQIDNNRRRCSLVKPSAVASLIEIDDDVEHGFLRLCEHGILVKRTSVSVNGSRCAERQIGGNCTYLIGTMKP